MSATHRKIPLHDEMVKQDRLFGSEVTEDSSSIATCRSGHLINRGCCLFLSAALKFATSTS